MTIAHRSLQVTFGVIFLSTMMCGCDWVSRTTPSWMGGEEKQSVSDKETAQKATDGTRIEIMRDTDKLEIIPDALEGITLSPPVAVDNWMQEGGGLTQATGHLKGSSFKEVIRHSEAGSGYDWNPLAIAPSPIVTDEAVFVMDGRGVISAHARSDIENVLWKSKEIYSKSALLAGGMAFSEGTLYAINGHGTLGALDAKTGATRWRRDLLEPVRSSLRVKGDTVLITTAESRLLAYETTKGT